jgi:DNA-binding MarR family transcriptional regulator
MDCALSSIEKAAEKRSPATTSHLMARLFSQAIGDAIAPLGLAPAQFMVLRELWKHDGLTQSQIARRLEVEQPTMANTLKRMTRDGLVTREPHPGDSRASLIRTTIHARSLEAAAKAAAKGVTTRAFAALTRKEQKRFLTLSQSVIDALQAPVTSDAEEHQRAA